MDKNHQLDLSASEMRSLGYRVIDLLVDHLTHLSEKPAARHTDRASLQEQLHETLPEEGLSDTELLELLEHEIFNQIMYTNHPRFFAFVPSPSNFVSVMADTLASGFNVFSGIWMEASSAAQIELTTIEWLCQACQMPATAGGLFVSGGSMANITALATAREIKLGHPTEKATIYFSDQTHSSIERGLRVLGFQPHQIRKITSNDRFQLDLSTLYQTIEADRADGLQPFCIVANAGTTNTGAIDPLPQLVEYCRQESLWLHVDGAYGAAAVFCEKGRKLLTGLGQVDSLSLDPHKWLFQPYEIGCVLVKNRGWLKETFHILPEYLADTETPDQTEEVNFCDLGIQLTRNFRALKLWLSLKRFGRSSFEQAQNRGFALAEWTETLIKQHPHWELITPAQMGIINFRYTPPNIPSSTTLNQLNQDLVSAIIDDGYALITSTTLREQTVLRMCTINPRTTETDIQNTLQWLNELAQRLHQK